MFCWSGKSWWSGKDPWECWDEEWDEEENSLWNFPLEWEEEENSPLERDEEEEDSLWSFPLEWGEDEVPLWNGTGRRGKFSFGMG